MCRRQGFDARLAPAEELDYATGGACAPAGCITAVTSVADNPIYFVLRRQEVPRALRVTLRVRYV